MTRTTDLVADLVKASVEIGASVARSAFAAATSAEPPSRGGAALQDLVAIGQAAAGNLAQYAWDAARAVGSFAATTAPAGGRDDTSSRRDDTNGGRAAVSRPRVTRGAVLRVPLLVENTGAEPTVPLDFAATRVERVSGDGGATIGVDQVTFAPPTLTVGSRDFEKLTVRIRTGDDTGLGVYRATVTGGDGWFSTDVEFEVTDPSG